MSEFLDDPSVLTKEKLKSALLANDVSLPNGEQKKDVYVQLYLKNLTAQNKKKSAPPEAFSSDDELPAPVVSNRSRSGRKATRKTDKPRPDEVDVLELSDDDLREQLQKYGVSVGPIVASTRNLYERKLQKLLDEGPPEAAPSPVAITETDGNHNGNTEFDHYSDKEEETAPPEPEPEPEPSTVVVERPLRSRGKTPVTTRTRSSQHNRRVALVEEERLLDEKEEEDEEEEQRLNIKRRFRRASPQLELAMSASDDIDFPDFPLSPVKPHIGDWRAELSEVLLMDKTFKSAPVESYDMDSTMPCRPAQENGTSQKVRDPQTARTGDNHQDCLSSQQKDKRGGTFTGSTDSVTKVPVVYLHDISHNKAKLPDPRPPVVLKPSEPSVFADANEGPQHNTAGRFVSSITSLGSCHEDSPAPLATRQGSASSQTRHRKTQVSQTVEQVSKESTTEVHKVDGRQQKITPFLHPTTPLRGQSDSPRKAGIEKVSTVETPKADARNMLKEMFPNDVNTPTGISATCRRPIRGAAARAGISTDSWLDESRLRLSETNYSSSSSSYLESRPSTRLLSSPPPASTYSSSASALRQTPASVLTARAPISGVPARRRRWLPVWAQVLAFGVLAGFLFLVYQAMETNESNPFGFLGQQADEAPAGQTSK